MSRNALLATLAAIMLVCGCAEFQELSIAARNRKAAAGAWKQARWDYWRQGVPHKIREHVGRGFEQGYFDVAAGGNGQIPLFPPQYYWGVKYQTQEGSAYIGAWFRGYQDGAMAAERDGFAMYNQIPTSWSPGTQATVDRPLNEVPGMTPGMPDGEIVPPVPPVHPGPVVPLQPQSELPEATPQPLMVPSPPGTVVPPPVLEPALPGKTTLTPPTGEAAPAVKAVVPAAPVAPPANVPPAPLRDPVGGKQTLLEPQTTEDPAAQASLFGELGTAGQ
ncbi:MAG: hypothetical protein QM775_13345 [Pirellulales bacterium]